MQQVIIKSTLPKSASLPDFLQVLKDEIDHAEDDDSESSSTASDDDFSDSDCSDWSGSFSDLEERATAFSAVGSTPAFAAMVFAESNTTTSRLGASTGQLQQSKLKNKDPLSGSSHSLRSSQSQKITGSSRPSGLIKACSFAMRRSNSDVIIQASDHNDTTTTTKDNTTTTDGTPGATQRKPDDVLQLILEEYGYTMKTFPAQSLDNFFLEMRPINMASYGNFIASAVRAGDLDMVKSHHEAGRTLQCCNKFHESILHTICRRGHVHLLQYILQEATDVTIQLRDDYGRTPLHDAAWTDRPNFELIKLLLKTCPDLLLITDQRGFTPMSYVGRQRWEEWCMFLEQNKELLLPKVLPL